jgi:hypothetical protein
MQQLHKIVYIPNKCIGQRNLSIGQLSIMFFKIYIYKTHFSFRENCIYVFSLSGLAVHSLLYSIFIEVFLYS